MHNTIRYRHVCSYGPGILDMNIGWCVLCMGLASSEIYLESVAEWITSRTAAAAAAGTQYALLFLGPGRSTVEYATLDAPRYCEINRSSKDRSKISGILDLTSS